MKKSKRRRKELFTKNVNRSKNQIENVILQFRLLTKLTLNLKANVEETRFSGSIRK